MYSWSRAITSLCNPGELFITEDWTYPSALANSQPYGVYPVGVPMDDQGMRPDALRKMLAEWDEVERGHKRYVGFALVILRCIAWKPVPTLVFAACIIRMFQRWRDYV